MQVTATDTQVTLYGTPVSNYSARCVFLMKRKALPQTLFTVRPPKDLGGGLKTEEYLKLNPLGKMPLVVIKESDGSQNSLFESSVICNYLAERFDSFQPTFLQQTAETRAKANLIVNALDLYVGPHHPFMYKRMDGVDRVAGVNNMHAGLDTIEFALDKDGPYAVGNSLSVADCCLWGNFAFYDFMLPTFFGWNAVDGRPKLAAWRKHMGTESEAAREVYTQVFNGLLEWWDSGRWEKLGMPALTDRPQIKW